MAASRSGAAEASAAAPALLPVSFVVAIAAPARSSIRAYGSQRPSWNARVECSPWSTASITTERRFWTMALMKKGKKLRAPIAVAANSGDAVSFVCVKPTPMIADDVAPKTKRRAHRTHSGVPPVTKTKPREHPEAVRAQPVMTHFLVPRASDRDASAGDPTTHERDSIITMYAAFSVLNPNTEVIYATPQNDVNAKNVGGDKAAHITIFQNPQFLRMALKLCINCLIGESCSFIDTSAST